MIVARVDEVKARLEERGWNKLHLAAEGGISVTTVDAVLAGHSVSGSTVSAVLGVLGGQFEDLFRVVGKEEQLAAAAVAGAAAQGGSQ